MLFDFKQFLEDKHIQYLENTSLKEYSTFKIGGNADFIVKPCNFTELKNIIDAIKQNNIKYVIIGNGSNVLFKDCDFNGVIILTTNLNEIEIINNQIIVSSGVTLSKLCSVALNNSLSGLEFAWGIPGSVGGAVYMNAGAYGGEIKDVLKSVKYLDENSNINDITIDKLDMYYRHSFFTDKNCIILSATFDLEKADYNCIKEKMDDFITRRKSKQPLEYPSCGSTFKRPVGNYASALIEQCNLKGYSVGGAEVSTKHSGFVINKNNATCEDVLKLVDDVKRIVKEKTGYQLECEIKII